MRTVVSIALALALVSLAGCFNSLRTPAGSAKTFTPATETGPYVVIGHLEHRDQVVTIKTGEQGTVYSVTNKKDGKILFENLTAEQLKSQSPQIHDFIEAAEAGQAGLSPIGIK